MKCAFCRTGETSPETVTFPIQKGDTTVILKGVPAEVCDTCGEQYFSEDVTGKIMKLAEEAILKGAEVEILKFAA
ncbi:MAG: type II toxin-antitoxin system MqsA family antitoxin [Nitrospinae bacterium]|nr:type II toxin-antitoxin system MqsA family antitoxin [Nitrospinota bacterium]